MLGILKRYGFAAVVTIGVALMVIFIVGKSLLGSLTDQPGGGGPGGGGGGRGAAPTVVVAEVALHRFTDGIQAIGTAQARESIVLTPKVADTIRQLRFDSGDRVRRGQVLVEMGNVEQLADLEEARAQNQVAQEELRRYQELFDRGFASQARLDSVRAAADAAQARVNAGASRIADRTITAPFAGLVGLRTASPGQFVRPGDQIGTLDDVSEIKLDFDVPETRLANLAAGVEIEARAAAYPERAFSGRIANVDSRVDPTTRTVRVRAMLPNGDEAVRPGMLMTVDVRSNPRDALAVPEIAVLDEAQGSFVYRIASGGEAQVAERVQVRLGQRSGGMAEVLDGLAAGDRIVTEGLQTIRPGQPVRVDGAGGIRPRGEGPSR
jgi:membrane fusion protein (multidrug efflux system)